MAASTLNPKTDLSAYALKSQVPTVGATPNSLGAKAAGNSPVAAAADHTHDFGAALQRSRVAATSSTKWTFDTPFPPGVVPVIGCLVECPTAGYVFSDMVTSVDNTQVTIALKCQAATLSISLGSLTLFGTAIPANTFLHLSARNPNV